MLMMLATGAWLVGVVGLVGGFAFVWSQLEDQRNARLNAYNKALASAADTIVNAWRSKPSINRVLVQVSKYGQGEVAADLQEVHTALRVGTPLAVALQRVADRRQSAVFDSLATALLLAAEASGEVTDMLSRQAGAARQMAKIYEETIDMQKGQRQDTMWGIIGPWGVLILIRFITILTGGVGYGTEFFASFWGQGAAVIAALLTVLAYVHSHYTASRGLLIERVGSKQGKGDVLAAG
jgi:Flp pilus assembly protein TadB